MSTEPSDGKSSQVIKDEIRFRAEQIYCARIVRGEPGNALDDWRHAQAELW